jgi:hypothetical protein
MISSLFRQQTPTFQAPVAEMATALHHMSQAASCLPPTSIPNSAKTVFSQGMLHLKLTHRSSSGSHIKQHNKQALRSIHSNQAVSHWCCLTCCHPS